ncbi:hypothetical protein KDH_28960 [Dictyobacter sp. S3.2.2.5]|uniref:Thioredoxin domain-containing protein n=1 Tax=Dictyobacter halimunensis TaxID=3026934 RepID=A0ABQ6FQP0_9CHLR|nr:hypothetical protein KDH_28960 [Dictyobacter sp. S3.2.2.5]
MIPTVSNEEEGVTQKSTLKKEHRWKWLVALMVGVLLILVGANVLFYVTRLSTAPKSAPVDQSYQGTDMGKTPAPVFQLHDQNGKLVSLQALRGRPVVLTFLYTTCPGPCPLTAEKMYSATQLLGAQAAQVHWDAVSVNPAVDNAHLATAFVAAHRLTGYLHFLLGTEKQLRPIWKDYAVGVTPAQGNAAMTHSVGIYLIDAQGRERVYLGSNFTPEMLAKNLQQLLANNTK